MSAFLLPTNDEGFMTDKNFALHEELEMGGSGHSRGEFR